ncbi:MAG: DUF1570 domain-containing protein, partial [Myxococcota bacterium]
PAEGFDLSVDTERAVDRIVSRMHGTYESWLGIAFPSPLVVHATMVESEAAYHAREPAVLGRSGHTSGYFVGATGEVVVWRGRGDATMRATLVHETSHYLLATAGLGRVPLWLQEGLAEVFETATVDGNAVYLVPNGDALGWIRGRSVPKASSLVGLDRQTWTALGATPWTRPEYPYGWALCAFLLSSDPGRRTLSDVLLSTAVSSDPGAAAIDAIGRSWPGGVDTFDQAFAAYSPGRIQLPIRSSSGQADGWAKCPDGSLIRPDLGAKCGGWVKGADGMSRWVEQRPVE